MSRGRWALALLVRHWVVEGAVALFIALAALSGMPEPPTVRLQPVVAQAPTRLNALAEVLDGREDIAAAILLEHDRTGIPVDLIVGIMRVENPWLLEDTVNWYGATGLMQVWDYHTGAYAEVCGPGDLTDVRTNVCYGVEILQEKIEAASGDTLTALLYYNGCWGSTYVPGCEDYPERVALRRED